MVLDQLGVPAHERNRFAAIAAVYAPLILVTVFICIRMVPEKRTGPGRHPNSRFAGWFKEITPILRNQPFLILLTAYTISAVGSNLPATLILYYVEYVLESRMAGVFLFLYFLTGIVCLPAWIRLSRIIEKKWAWITAMLINTGAFFGVFFLGPGDSAIYGVLVVISGIGFGAGLALPSSIQADVIDYDEMITGQRREGRFIGLWSVARKLAAALGVGTALYVLGSTGYSPNISQGPQVIWALRILYALVPCICNALAIFILFFYPISRAAHENIRQTIRNRS